MAFVYKELFPDTDIRTARSFLNQLIDVIQEDISGSTTRKKYQVFVTGGVGPGVTSSLFQTIFDQDFSLQTANAVFDMTVGLFSSGTTVTGVKSGEDSAGKFLFPSTSIMMREKIDVYKQFAQNLLGNADSAFYSPFSSTDTTSVATAGRVNEALFFNFKRLFHRDGIKRETFAVKMYTSASIGDPGQGGVNLSETSESGSAIFTDVGAASNRESAFGGQVGNVVDSANTANNVGLIFYDKGIVVLDASKVISGTQHVSGVIDGMSPAAGDGATAAGKVVIGNAAHNARAKFIPDLFTSASIDDIVDHFATTRFSSGTLTAATFQNQTNINSTLFFCRATADEFNYSSNPTYINSDNRIRAIDAGEGISEGGSQLSFTMVTTVGLYDSQNNLLAVAKLSRPVEKNFEKDITFRVRLDF
tara:strand:- start:18082 stop:19335 length:1254 start_codon:yes stop_codon:yes gene_type:complete